MNEQKNNGRGIFYGVIGVATLVVAIIGATFAYFTATASNEATITGNMATVSFDLAVEKVVDPGASKGMIPMSNAMVQAAINNQNTTPNDTCVDDNGNAVCQVYKITVTNNSSAAMFVDGYIALKGGSGIVTDYTYNTSGNNSTTMRWAQVFKVGTGTDADSHYTTAGDQILGADTEKVTMSSLDVTTGDDVYESNDTKNTGKILSNSSDILGTTSISGNTYTTVKTNFIRVSDHKINTETTNLETSFDRTADLTSMLVLSQQLQPVGAADNKNIATYYFVVWLSETGNNQTAGATVGEEESPTTNPEAENFFNGIVTFVSAQGSEVTATFNGYTAVRSDQTPAPTVGS